MSRLGDSYRPSWDILITTIPHRHEKLRGLLDDLNTQIREADPNLLQVGVRVYRDNLKVTYGAKIRALQEASLASYVSCVDDDDLLAPGSVARVLEALAGWPDYVGFTVAWTRDGTPQLRIEHSLRFGNWGGNGEMLFRDVSEKNPMRREKALAGHWEGGYGAEGRWAHSIRTSGVLRADREAWLPDPPVYLYRESTADTFQSSREPLPGDAIPPLPSYSWLRVLTTLESV
jgi:hypothetical protein